jgi:hypothetical protein
MAGLAFFVASGAFAAEATDAPFTAYNLNENAAEAHSSDVPNVCSDGGENDPLWSVTAGTIFLTRSRPDNGILVGNNPFTGTSFSNASNFNFDWDAGIDLSIARRFECGDSIRVRFFEVDDLTSTQTFSTPGGFIGTGFTGPANTLFQMHYLTRLYSTEINWERPTSDYVTFIAGFRMLQLTDQLHSQINTTVAGAHYDYLNQLYGGQVGMNVNFFKPCSPWELGLFGKIGVYGNAASGGIDDYAGNNFIGGFHGNLSETSFVGETGIHAAYHMNDYICFRAGYEFLFLDNVALASDKAATSLLNPSLLRTDTATNSIYFHGVTASVEFTW